MISSTFARRRHRSSHRFVPGTTERGIEGNRLESRSLTVPVFVRTAAFNSLYDAYVDCEIPNGFPVVDYESSPTPGPVATATAQGSFMGLNQLSSGTVTNSGLVPAGPTSNLRGIEIIVSHQHSVTGNAFGGSGGFLTQTTSASGSDSFQMVDSNPGVPLSGVIDVHFSITLSAVHDGSIQPAYLNFQSPFLNVQGGFGGLVVDDGQGNTLLDDPNWGLSGSGDSYTVAFQVPAMAQLGFTYLDEFTTLYNSGFKGADVIDTPSFSWSVSLASNP